MTALRVQINTSLAWPEDRAYGTTQRVSIGGEGIGLGTSRDIETSDPLGVITRTQFDVTVRFNSDSRSIYVTMPLGGGSKGTGDMGIIQGLFTRIEEEVAELPQDAQNEVMRQISTIIGGQAATVNDNFSPEGDRQTQFKSMLLELLQQKADNFAQN